jgi:ribonuclease BN (tRNA processing enzyme)
MGQAVTLSVTVLGTSGMFATSERACAGYLLEWAGYRLWMDAGAGAWRNLLEHASYPSIDAVLLTHRHSDHTTDVFQAVHARQYGGPEPLDPIPLWAPQETLDRLQAFDSEIAETFVLTPLMAGQRLEVHDAGFDFVEMVHPPVTLGVRVTCDGGVLAYSADTGPTADLAALARSADVFLCEATLQDADEPWYGHMSAAQAGAAAADLGVDRLLLTHLPPGRDPALSLAQARGACGRVGAELAADGQRLEIVER